MVVVTVGADPSEKQRVGTLLGSPGLHRVSCASRMRDAAGTLRQHGNKTVIDLLKVSWESVVIGKLILL